MNVRQAVVWVLRLLLNKRFRGIAPYASAFMFPFFVEMDDYILKTCLSIIVPFFVMALLCVVEYVYHRFKLPTTYICEFDGAKADGFEGEGLRGQISFLANDPDEALKVAAHAQRENGFRIIDIYKRYEWGDIFHWIKAWVLRQ